ncbi:MAG TPA: hypothetical protein VI981_01970 [Candidatus Paceibacterota bacterium]
MIYGNISFLNVKTKRQRILARILGTITSTLMSIFFGCGMFMLFRQEHASPLVAGIAGVAVFALTFWFLVIVLVWKQTRAPK